MLHRSFVTTAGMFGRRTTMPQSIAFAQGVRKLSTTTQQPKPRRIRKALLGSSALLIGGGLYAKQSDEGFARTLYFYRHAMPPYFHYRWVQFQTRNVSQEERTAEFDKLHELYQDVPLQIMLHLQGFYTKFGQIVSGLDGGIVPKIYVEKLKVLQDNVPPKPTELIIQIIEKDLGCKIEEIFSEFDPVPLGAASIGQVHTAKLLDGTKVVVKVQYPDTERFFRMDIATLKSFCAIAQPEQLPLFDEIEKQFMTEFDYQLEAEQLRQAGTNVKPYYPDIVIPMPVDSDHPQTPRKEGLCTRKVLVMERLVGQSLQKSQREYLHKMAQDAGKTVEELEHDLREEIESLSPEELEKKVPSEFTLKMYKNILLGKDLIRNTAAFTYNWTLGWVGAPIKYEWTLAPINSFQVLDKVYNVHGHQLFHDGYFNGDPHPGNIMMLDDGRIGLVDYGQVKRMTLEDRLKLARLVIALADEDDDMVVQRWIECGYRTKHMNPRVIRANAYFSFDRWTPDIVDEFGGLALFQEELQKVDPCEHLPQEFIMAFRLSALMRLNAMGLGHVAGKYSQTCKVWRPHAVKLLCENGEDVE